MEDVQNSRGGKGKEKVYRSAKKDWVVDGSHIFGDMPKSEFGSGNDDENNFGKITQPPSINMDESLIGTIIKALQN